MITKNNQQVLVGAAIIFRDRGGKKQFLLVKQKEDVGWEIPKVTVRRGESSVRAVIRMTSEQGGMTARVLEEAGRTTSTSLINGKSVFQKFYYYIMFQKAGSQEIIGMGNYEWLEYSQALKKLALKIDKEMLENSKKVLKEWEKTHRLK